MAKGRLKKKTRSTPQRSAPRKAAKTRAKTKARAAGSTARTAKAARAAGKAVRSAKPAARAAAALRPSGPKVPRYKDLKRPDSTGLPLAWGLWAPGDQLGTINNITPAVVTAARSEIQRGVRFNLDLPLHIPYGLCKPGAHATRRDPVPTLHARERPPNLWVRDDKLDDFYLQCSSQWDGLTHMGDSTHGFYNGVQPANVTHGETSRNGIEHLAEFGIATRCVLVDIVRDFAALGKKWDPMAEQVVTAADLEASLKRHKVALRQGDVLLVRMGWIAAFRAAPDVEARDALLRAWKYSGVSGGEDMWEFLWDHRVAAIATDTVTVEVWPMRPGQPAMHWAIARLGITIGEMFDLDALAADCAKDGRYTAFFTSSPLNLRGGVGSPPNALAVK
jgi:kynurenine formamidase